MYAVQTLVLGEKVCQCWITIEDLYIPYISITLCTIVVLWGGMFVDKEPKWLGKWFDGYNIAVWPKPMGGNGTDVIQWDGKKNPTQPRWPWDLCDAALRCHMTLTPVVGQEFVSPISTVTRHLEGLETRPMFCWCTMGGRLDVQGGHPGVYTPPWQCWF